MWEIAEADLGVSGGLDAVRVSDGCLKSSIDRCATGAESAEEKGDPRSDSDPALETPMFLPLSCSIVWIGESQGTPMPRNGSGPVDSHMPIIGAPLATSAISVPAPSPISRAPAAMA